MKRKKYITLELTNSMSTYGTLVRAFKDDENNKYYFGDNDEIDYQTRKQYIPPLRDITRVKLESIDKIRIWMSSINTNDQVFTALMLNVFRDYLEKITIVDVLRKCSEPRPMHTMVGCNTQNELRECLKHERKLCDSDINFYKKLLRYYGKRDESLKSFIMVKGTRISELKHSTFKRYILETMNGYVRTPHLIGRIMSAEWDERGWIFGDNVIYKFIIDLINEGKILINSSYFEQYSRSPILHKKENWYVVWPKNN